METASQQPANSTKRVPGRPFQPGKSGNPNGRPPKDARLRELERVTREQAAAALERLAGPALKVLQKALHGRDQALAIKAAVDVLDRTQGRAVQRIEGHLDGPERSVIVSVEDLRAAAAKLLTSTATDVVELPQVVEVEPVELDRP